MGNILINFGLDCIDLRVHVRYGVLQLENAPVDGRDDPLFGRCVFGHEFNNLETKRIS
jgi:hypothetical protein